MTTTHRDRSAHNGRQVGRHAFTQGYTNLVSGVTHTYDEVSGYQGVEQQPFTDSQGNPTPQHARATERYGNSIMEGHQDLGQDRRAAEGRPSY